MENHVADQIRFYRRQEGLTQEQLAEAMGVSVAAVSKWEQGQSLPEIPMLMELADFFDLSVDALLGYRLRSNDRKSVSERLKVLRREDRYDEGLAEAEKALQKFPNTFTVVYECAKLFEMAGGTPAAALDAASNALCALMGLVCDPVGGLVEIPCQKRNGSAAAVALTCAQIALAGVPNLVPFDETVAAMDAVGRTLPATLRETALGGIAAAPSACAWCAQGCGE